MGERRRALAPWTVVATGSGPAMPRSRFEGGRRKSSLSGLVGEVVRHRPMEAPVPHRHYGHAWCWRGPRRCSSTRSAPRRRVLVGDPRALPSQHDGSLQKYFKEEVSPQLPSSSAGVKRHDRPRGDQGHAEPHAARQGHAARGRARRGGRAEHAAPADRRRHDRRPARCGAADAAAPRGGPVGRATRAENQPAVPAAAQGLRGHHQRAGRRAALGVLHAGRGRHAAGAAGGVLHVSEDGGRLRRGPHWPADSPRPGVLVAALFHGCLSRREGHASAIPHPLPVLEDVRAAARRLPHHPAPAGGAAGDRPGQLAAPEDPPPALPLG
ncbi:unnamed protein product, partial [Heterosigma akashiwo]